LEQYNADEFTNDSIRKSHINGHRLISLYWIGATM